MGDLLLTIGQILLAVVIFLFLVNFVRASARRQSRIRESREQLQHDAALKARYPDLHKELQQRGKKSPFAQWSLEQTRQEQEERKEASRELEHDRFVQWSLEQARKEEQERGEGEEGTPPAGKRV
jgi:hypothetical protein